MPSEECVRLGGAVACHWLNWDSQGLSFNLVTGFLSKAPGPTGRVYPGQCWGHSRSHVPTSLFPDWGLRQYIPQPTACLSPCSHHKHLRWQY